MTYQSKIAGIVHRAIEGAHRVGVVDKATMREFDKICRNDAGEKSPKRKDCADSRSPRRSGRKALSTG